MPTGTYVKFVGTLLVYFIYHKIFTCSFSAEGRFGKSCSRLPAGARPRLFYAAAERGQEGVLRTDEAH